MQHYAAYRARVFAHLNMATGIDVRRLSSASLAMLPDYYRAGLGIHDTSDRLLDPDPAPEPFPREARVKDDGPCQTNYPTSLPPPSICRTSPVI